MTDLGPWYAARDELTNRLATELIGPGAPEPQAEKPLDRFVAGILFPLTPDERDVLAAEEHDASVDEEGGAGGDEEDGPVPREKTRRPSSLGLTTYAPRSSQVDIRFSAGRYRLEEEGWIRSEVQMQWTVDVEPGPPTHIDSRDVEGLQLRAYVRGGQDSDLLAVTVSATLQAYAAPGQQDSSALFQCALELTCSDGFGVLPGKVVADSDEDAADAMLYRDRRGYALGHGCSVDWSDSPLVTRVWSTFLPQYDLALASASRKDVPDLTMQSMADHSVAQELGASLAQAYRDWIDARRSEVSDLPLEHQPAAQANLDRATTALGRIEGGLRLLDTDAVAWEAFRLMNLSMSAQRTRGAVGQAEPAWRPFQLAFILMNLNGLADPRHPDREVADLLWFPTGGGKTEAYLGLVSFSLWHRRLIDPEDAGLSVLMRYTLRLLTLQQFQRAARLICAMEILRVDELPAAKEFTIGMWVGRASTPNSLRDANSALKKLASGSALREEESDPTQLKSCPWCSADITARDYEVGAGRMNILCPGQNCDYNERYLPVILVDEEIYSRRPSMVIATVDKFAMMAWEPRFRSLFSADGRHSRPSLIIQDELHLISGPLGTLVGLYESAVDLIATEDGVRPKIVASTATIRRSSEQVRAVFAREPSLFPAPGISPDDNFFAVDAPAEEIGNRRYVGVLAGGASHSSLFIRVAAVLLQTAAELESDDAVRDTYWTLVAYFNSLRVLGSAVVQFRDDVPDVLKYLGKTERAFEEVSELTSRVAGREIGDRLRQLEVSYPSKEAVDVVAATNMISVGLDVDRLGLMTVMGQPQAAAEYIQATSRVGRRFPGLVVDVLNSARSRDLSHFEGFKMFHSALYRQVEPVSVTPFSPRARDRGLHGVLLSAIRALVPGLNEAPQPVGDVRSDVAAVVEGLVDRCKRVAPEDAEGLGAEIEELLRQWREWATLPSHERSPYVDWSRVPDPSKVPLLKQADGQSGFPVGEPPWHTLTSLRNVDGESPLVRVSDWIRE